MPAVLLSFSQRVCDRQSLLLQRFALFRAEMLCCSLLCFNKCLIKWMVLYWRTALTPQSLFDYSTGSFYAVVLVVMWLIGNYSCCHVTHCRHRIIFSVLFPAFWDSSCLIKMLGQDIPSSYKINNVAWFTLVHLTWVGVAIPSVLEYNIKRYINFIYYYYYYYTTQ